MNYELRITDCCLIKKYLKSTIIPNEVRNLFHKRTINIKNALWSNSNIMNEILLRQLPDQNDSGINDNRTIEQIGINTRKLCSLKSDDIALSDVITHQHVLFNQPNHKVLKTLRFNRNMKYIFWKSS